MWEVAAAINGHRREAAATVNRATYSDDMLTATAIAEAVQCRTMGGLVRSFVRRNSGTIEKQVKI
jgi:hypothetical protein